MKPFLVLCIFSILVSCSPQITVFSDHDPDYDLSAYKTFDWSQKQNIEQGKNPLHYNELTDKRVKTAINQQMSQRGYQLSATNAELILHYHIIVDDQSIVSTEPYGYRYGPYWMRTQTNVYSYREGTIILDVMDSKTSELIWRGWAVSAIDRVNPEEVDELIKDVVRRIFKKYPKTDGQ